MGYQGDGWLHSLVGSSLSGKPLQGETESVGAHVLLKLNTREVQGETGRLGKDAVAKLPARDRDRSLILEGGLSDIIRLLL